VFVYLQAGARGLWAHPRATLASFSELLDAFVWGSEAQYGTRASGALTRAVDVLDLSDFARFGRRGFLNARFHRIQTAVSQHNEAHYPALLCTIVAVNVPWVARQAARAIEAVAPRFAGKVKVYENSTAGGEDEDGKGRGDLAWRPYAERVLVV